MKKIHKLIVSLGTIAFLGFSATTAAAGTNIPAYKIAAYSDVEGTKAKLLSAGFEVVGTYNAPAGTTVLYTNAQMKAMANKPTRGLAAVGRLLIDEEEKQISIANPIYFGKAFMQKEYSQTTASNTLKALTKAFGTLKDSTDQWDANELSDYHFMMGMPYYGDMSVVGEGATAELVAKAQKAKGTTAVVKLSDTRYVAFVEMDRRTNGFVKKIGTRNGEILPWAVLIEDGKAKALNAKYFIAISYPMLTMNEFMTIATVPGAIESDLKKIFK